MGFDKWLSGKMKALSYFFGSSFSFGILAGISLVGLFQDLLGKDKYIQLVNDQWVSEWVTIPLSLLVIILCYAVYRSRENG